MSCSSVLARLLARDAGQPSRRTSGKVGTDQARDMRALWLIRPLSFWTIKRSLMTFPLVASAATVCPVIACALMAMGSVNRPTIKGMGCVPSFCSMACKRHLWGTVAKVVHDGGVCISQSVPAAGARPQSVNRLACRSECMAYVRSLSLSKNHAANRSRFVQPVYGWPFSGLMSRDIHFIQAAFPFSHAPCCQAANRAVQ